ncbi:MAG TPA: YqgE/AlgH family protein [Steroidobacteraceae bacterium]|nr:YqgE/AlgH family protein [Steroidobacteraceae bacterium]
MRPTSDTAGMAAAHSLTNHFLIAMPGMADPNFTQTVTYIIRHSGEGAQGIVINRPTNMHLARVFEQLKFQCSDAAIEVRPVLQGGPIETEQGFVIHRPCGNWEYTQQISERVHITNSRDILAAMARGEEPRTAIVALGYAGWGAGQLEAEIAANAWLTVESNEAVIFDVPYAERWRAAGRLLGIDVMKLGVDAGHA